MVLRILGIVLVVAVGVWIVGQVLQLIVPALIVGGVVLVGAAGYTAVKRRNQRQIGS